MLYIVSISTPFQAVTVERGNKRRGNDGHVFHDPLQFMDLFSGIVEGRVTRVVAFEGRLEKYVLDTMEGNASKVVNSIHLRKNRFPMPGGRADFPSFSDTRHIPKQDMVSTAAAGDAAELVSFSCCCKLLVNCTRSTKKSPWKNNSRLYLTVYFSFGSNKSFNLGIMTLTFLLLLIFL